MDSKTVKLNLLTLGELENEPISKFKSLKLRVNAPITVVSSGNSVIQKLTEAIHYSF